MTFQSYSVLEALCHLCLIDGWVDLKSHKVTNKVTNHNTAIYLIHLSVKHLSLSTALNLCYTHVP